MSDAVWIVIAFYAGYVTSWLLHRKPPIDLALVNAWLNKHGLTWQPKGAVFDPGKAVKK